MFISALTGQRVDRLFDLIHYVNDQAATRISTGMLNTVLADATARVQPPTDKGRRLKIYYMTQVGIKPPHFVCFCNDARLFHFSYQRYLENQIRDTFGLEGTPVRLTIRQKGDKGGWLMPWDWTDFFSFPGFAGWAAAIAYFCGCFNGAVIVSKYILRDDVRTHGSGNAGLTNFLPHLRWPADLCGHPCDDVVKAVVAVLIAGIGGRFCDDAGYALGRRWTAFRGLVQVLGGPLLPAGSYVPLHVPFQGRQGHPPIAIMIDWHHRPGGWSGSTGATSSGCQDLTGTERKFSFHQKKKNTTEVLNMKRWSWAAAAGARR